MSDLFPALGAAIGSILNPVPASTLRGTPRAGAVVSIGLPNDPKPFFFTDMEIPEQLQFGVEQISAVNKHIGGIKTIDLFGSLDKPITISGRLYNLDDSPPTIKSAGKPRYEVSELAIGRAQRLGKICTQGNKILLQFHQFQFFGAVLSADITAINLNEYTFTITIEVTNSNFPDLDGVKTAGQTAGLNPTADFNLLQAISQAVSALTNLANFATKGIALANAIKQLSKIKPGAFLNFIPGSQAVLTLQRSADNAIAGWNQLTDQSAPQALLDFQNGQPYGTLTSDALLQLKEDIKNIRENMGPVNEFHTNIVPTLRPSGAVLPVAPYQADPEVLTNVLNLTVEVFMRLGVASKTIDQMIAPIRSNIITVKNPDLALVALQHYGDSTQWTAIAAANNLSGRMPQGTFQLVLPFQQDITATTGTLNPTTSGGAG